MLREDNRKWLEEQKNLREKGILRKRLRPDEEQRLRRIRKSVPESIKYLTLLLETLPEKELEQIFTVENMQPFLNALLSLRSENEEKRRRRVIDLWNVIFRTGVLSHEYGLKIVGDRIWQIVRPTREEDVLRVVCNYVLYGKEQIQPNPKNLAKS